MHLCFIAVTIALLAGFVSLGHADIPSCLTNSEYLLRGWSTMDGLPEDSATSIVQTQDGYVWFATFKGLVRYNGDQFTVLDPDNTPELPSAGIVNLHRDKHDRLWVSTYQGLVLREGPQWRPLRQPDGTPLGMVRTFSERANGDVLVTTTFDGKVYQSSGTDLAELPSPPGTQGDSRPGLPGGRGCYLAGALNRPRQHETEASCLLPQRLVIRGIPFLPSRTPCS